MRRIVITALVAVLAGAGIGRAALLSWHLAESIVYNSNPQNGGPWALLHAGNPPDSGALIDIDPADYALFTLWNYNAIARRMMWYPTAGDIWSQPSIRIYAFNLPGQRMVQMLVSDTRDAIVSWTSPFSGEVELDGWVRDADPASGTGILRISRWSGQGLDDGVLAEVTINNNPLEQSPDLFNLTTQVNAGDVLYFRKTFYKPDASGTEYAWFDVTINLLRLQGDANGDGRVDGEDFLIWQAGFGTQAGATWDQGDFNGDGRVDGEDFLIWQAHFGSVATATTAVTPEPATAAVMALAGLLALRRRQYL